MSYIVRSTEKTQSIASEYETKAMLYLLEYRDDSGEITKFAIDFFNDVTGLNDKTNKAWDVQSKGSKSNSPKEIGKELVTLLKNYLSDLKFEYSILFLGGVSNTLRIDQTKTVFGIENIKGKALDKLKNGLIEESVRISYINDKILTEEKINDFLKTVCFVVDDKTKAEYIKNIIKVNEKYIPNDEMLEAIFNQIRDKQSSKKNNGCLEGTVISKLSDVFHYDRTIDASSIKLLILNTFINCDIMDQNPPMCFLEVLKNYDSLQKRDVIENCKLKIATVLFDKVNSDKFWQLIALVYDSVYANREETVDSIYDLIENEDIYLNSKLDSMSVMYLISLVKEALQ